MEKKNVQEPEWYKDALNNPSTIQFVDEFVYSYTDDETKVVNLSDKEQEQHLVYNLNPNANQEIII